METETTIAKWQAQPSGDTVFFVLATSQTKASNILTTKDKGAFTLTHMDVPSGVPVPGPTPTSTAPASSTKGGGTKPAQQVGLPVTLQTIGVLGKTPTQKGTEDGPIDIPENHIVVDPAGLPYITGASSINVDAKGKGGAGGLSGPIYAHYHLKDSNGNQGLLLNDTTGTGFPAEVRQNITKEGQAFAHQYYEGAVIHVVGPDFRVYQQITLDGAVEKLSEAYYNVILVAEKHVQDITAQNENNAYKKGAVVRLPLISMGVFAGHFEDIRQKAELTARAVIEAFRKYGGKGTPKPAAPVFPTQYWMCLFQSNVTQPHYIEYEAAFKKHMGSGS